MSDIYTQIKDGLDDFEGKLKKGFEKNEAKFREIDEELLVLRQRPDAKFARENITTKSSGLGGKVWEACQANIELLTKTDKIRLEVKAAGDVLGTSAARTIQSGSVGSPSGMAIGSFNAFPARSIPGVTAIEYSRYTGIEGAADVQAAEGDAKAAVRPTFSLITQPGITIAGWTKISKQAMSDSAQLQRAIDITLRRSIHTKLDAVLNSASWGGAAGLLAHATSYTSLVYTGMADAASEGVATMQEAGFAPDTVVIKPADWLAIVTAKAAGSGEYLSGSYLNALPENLRGMKVILSPTVTAGKVLVLDSAHVELQVIEDMTIEIGTVDDDFTRNLRTILGEMRVIPTFLSVGAARLITPKA